MRKTRLLLAAALLFLAALTTKYPIFTPFELAGLEGEEVPLYYVKILGKDGRAYQAELGFTRERINIVSDGTFTQGDVASFYGVVKDGVLINQEYRLHPYPNLIYYLSALGLVVFLALFFRKWGFSLKEMRFKEV